ncbi:hypothetical protein L4C36_13120 [Photobacterium japonica]|uniref:hypothetical protein n=1 Tax=Photobacterium japonica TaxID=2910235 RepID=UPI003D0BD3D2
MNNAGYVGLAIALLSPLSMAVAMDMETVLRTPTVKLGVVKASGNVEVSQEGVFDDAPFNSSTAISPFLMLIQPPAYFTETTRWGYHTELSGSYFKLDYDGDDHKGFRDGELDGYSVSFTPVLFYQWGDKDLCSGCKSWRLEAGVGAHYVDIDGKLIADTPTGQQTAFSAAGWGVNAHLGAVVNYKRWELGLRLVVPTTLDDDDIEVEHGLSSVSLGYRF